MDPAQFVSPGTPVQSDPHCCSKHMFGWSKIFGILGIAVVLMLFWTWLSSPMVITITGIGTVTVPATSASISFNILSSDATVQGAINAVTAKANAIHTVLRNNGIAETDIMQTQVTATPVVSGGFQTLIQMAAKTTNVSIVSGLISTLYTNGASSVSQPVLVVENQNDLQEKAFEDAMKDASTQATNIAIKHWKLVRKIINVSQTSSGSTSTTSSKTDATVPDTSQLAGSNGVFKIAQAVSVSYKMW